MHGWLTSLGATTFQAEDGKDALHKMTEVHPDLMICDISMPRMNGLELVETLRNRGEQLPILMISATENMADIAKALRLGVQDVLLKPVKDFDRLRETVYACLYPAMFSSRVEEEERLFEDWDALVSNPIAASRLLQELQPPVQQEMSHCRVHYRQLVSADKPGLVLDIAPLSENDLAFYCLDVTRAGEPVLIYQRTGAPVAVSPVRSDAVRALLAEHAVQIIITDDGLQHYALARDKEIVVIDGVRRFGNGWWLPAGPMRERASRLKSVDAVIVNGGEAKTGEIPMHLQPGMAVNLVTGERRPVSHLPALVAMAGIGHPPRFFSTLEQGGADMVEERH